ncbi:MULTISPECIES: retropepsin-like aspartic protease family protein [Giesbergeria]|uniref:TIGR02281 family clan AA aspartic protease n=1 Tax=Giesbergeria sinuosa TaxID=80883 RepID=A0ABV9QC77_9BURK
MPPLFRPPIGSALAAVLLALAPTLTPAQTVALSGVLGHKALLVVGNGAPRAMAAGETHLGVRVISVGKDEAVVEVAGSRSTLQLGQAPVSVGGSGGGSGRRVVLMADARGHFVQQGQINGQPMPFMIDTGASTIALGQAQAQRLGLDYRSGQPVRMSTANGTAQGWRLRLDSVRLGDVQVYGIEAVVTPQPMPYVLLGNNFLNHFQMTRTPDQMVLEKRR